MRTREHFKQKFIKSIEEDLGKEETSKWFNRYSNSVNNDLKLYGHFQNNSEAKRIKQDYNKTLKRYCEYTDKTNNKKIPLPSGQHKFSIAN